MLSDKVLDHGIMVDLNCASYLTEKADHIWFAHYGIFFVAVESLHFKHNFGYSRLSFRFLLIWEVIIRGTTCNNFKLYALQLRLLRLALLTHYTIWSIGVFCRISYNQSLIFTLYTRPWVPACLNHSAEQTEYQLIYFWDHWNALPTSVNNTSLCLLSLNLFI